jgi:hypothetical protein
MRCDAARPWPPPTRAIERTSSVAIITKSKRQGQRGHDDSDACARANRTRRRKSRRARARARGRGRPRTGPSRQAKPVLRCASRVRKSSLGTPPPPFVRLAEDESQDGRTDGRAGVWQGMKSVLRRGARARAGAHGGLVTWRSVRIVQGARAYCTYDTTPCGGHSS